ncbi:MAG: FAD-dependent oxidoreductase [Bdellovibrionales bacterium]
MKNIDVAIFGAGIAGLWVFHRLKSMGYDALLLESGTIGGGQSIASQGIIHSGLKYAIAGQVNDLARSISAMPDLWRAALRGIGPIDLSAARIAAESQYMLIPSGFMGGLVKVVSKKALGGNVHEIPKADWPADIKNSGFQGSVIFMGEPVLDVPSVLRALAEPYSDSIKKSPTLTLPLKGGGNEAGEYIRLAAVGGGEILIKPKYKIFTAAGSNHPLADAAGHGKGLKTQKRPLLMGMMKNAPFEIYAHMVGASEKPIATITSHRCADGSLVWYLGGSVAERDKDANPQAVFAAARKAFAKYMPDVDLSHAQWAVLPIDRVEGKSDTQGWLPDTPTIHAAGNALYCWPTKLTFAPMLADMVVEKLTGLKPSGHLSDFSDLESVPYSDAPWDAANWVNV